MKLSLYLDEDSMARSVVAALRARGADVVTVIEAGLRGKDDQVQLQSGRRRKEEQSIHSTCRTSAGFTSNTWKAEPNTQASS